MQETVLEFLTKILGNWPNIYLKVGRKTKALPQIEDQQVICRFLQERLREYSSKLARSRMEEGRKKRVPEVSKAQEREVLLTDPQEWPRVGTALGPWER